MSIWRAKPKKARSALLGTPNAQSFATDGSRLSSQEVGALSCHEAISRSTQPNKSVRRSISKMDMRTAASPRRLPSSGPGRRSIRFPVAARRADQGEERSRTSNRTERVGARGVAAPRPGGWQRRDQVESGAVSIRQEGGADAKTTRRGKR